MPGIYIHVPFCRSRCIYCDFYSTTLPPAWHMPYAEAIERELEMRLAASPLSPGRELTTLYIGGGTPSQLAPDALLRIFRAVEKHFAIPHTAEITIEANPDDVTPEWIALLRDTPANRVSMGVQSLDDGILHTLHRRHTAGQARRAVGLLQQAGYLNLSLDLIYGLPGQGREQFASDVSEILSLGVPHLSAYALQFEPDTPLFSQREQGIVQEADEELSLACYERLIDLTAEAGMEHYEISNFARPGFRSRHNSAYWTGVPYVGLGPGAHSYDGRQRRSYNCEDLQAYIKGLRQGKLPSTAEDLSDTDRYNERIMLRLRTSEGLSLTDLEHDFGSRLRRYCETMAAPHLEQGRLQKKADETLCLTRQGLFVSDAVISDMMAVPDE